MAGRFARRGGVYATHMRDEQDKVLDSIAETMATAKRAEIPVVISHHKCAGVHNWGRTTETLPLIAEAAKHQAVNLDAYPYTAGSTNLRADLITDKFRIMIAWSRPHPEATGRDLADIAREWKCSPTTAWEVSRYKPRSPWSASACTERKPCTSAPDSVTCTCTCVRLDSDRARSTAYNPASAKSKARASTMEERRRRENGCECCTVP